MYGPEELIRAKRDLRFDKVTSALAVTLMCGIEGWFIEADAPIWLKVGYAALGLGSTVPAYRRIRNGQEELDNLQQIAVSQAEEINSPEDIYLPAPGKLVINTVNHDYSPDSLRQNLGLNNDNA